MQPKKQKIVYGKKNSPEIERLRNEIKENKNWKFILIKNVVCTKDGKI